MADFLLDLTTSELSQGLQALVDTTDAGIGSAQVMTNMVITDRGGIGPRPGTKLLGTYNSTAAGCVGFYNFVKSGVATELLVKDYDGIKEFYHPDLLDWYQIKSGYTVGAEFGYKEHLINTDNEDYLYFGNAKENYSRWSGAYAQTVGAYASGTTLTVDSTLKTTTYETGTSTGTSTTTITDSTKTWSSDPQWKGFYVLITSGAQAGVIRIITDSGSNFVSFGAMTDPGVGCTYQFRLPKFAASGNLTVGTTTVAYSAIPTSTTFTITDPSVALAAGLSVTNQPTEYPGNPRGNRFENHHTRMVVGGVQSGMSRDVSGNLQGSQSTATVYVSNLKNATSFTFSSPRVAGEGDIISAPYGGGNITDIVNYEDSFAVFKPRYIELDQYPTSDANDILTSTPLKTGFGSVGRVIKGKDDVYFVTVDNQITSLSRVQLKDTVPQTTNIGLPIKRLLDTFDFSNVYGDEFGQRLFFTCKGALGDSTNNQVLVYNQLTKSFEGIWLLSAFGFQKNGKNFYYAESNGANVWQMFTGVNDVRVAGTAELGITATWKSNWIHLVPRRSRFRVKPSQFQTQGINILAFEGYIKDGTNINFSMFTDFGDSSSLSFSFGNATSDTAFITGSDLGVFLGDNPLGLEPLGTLSDPSPDGNRHFKFIVYFPDIYCNYLALQIDSSGTNQSYEVTRIGLGTSENDYMLEDSIKTIN